ncbi:MAG: hypothetical protein ACRCYT_00685 [Cetobacterium sp.]|uniref:hypothetical protein n=1 Tax=Cetobacterium sp. TaxID=2071632 RepID=UPI003F31B53D
MKFIATKQWKELPSKMITANIPSVGLVFASQETEPTDGGIVYSGMVKSFYSDQKLWVKLKANCSSEIVAFEIENFM